MSLLKLVVRAVPYVWAAPYSAVGLMFGLLGVLFGARMRVHSGALEFCGGRVGKLWSRLPSPVAFSAITFGHVILGIDHATLATVRTHEHVHVRQYARWGPLFVPAYLLSSLVQLVRGRDPYLDNYFEREAYAKASAARTGSNPSIEQTATGMPVAVCSSQPSNIEYMPSKKIALTIVFIWFLTGGIGHFVAPDFFLKIIHPSLPFRLQAVYISGFFEVVGALGLVHLKFRRAAGIGLFVLTIAVTPANIYMWLNPQLFPKISEILLALRLVVQIVLLALIWWATLPETGRKSKHGI